MTMTLSEVLTLLLVIFAALNYIDGHKKKQHPYRLKCGCYFKISNLTEGKSDIVSGSLPDQIIHQGCLFFKQLFLNFLYTKLPPVHTQINLFQQHILSVCTPAQKIFIWYSFALQLNTPFNLKFCVSIYLIPLFLFFCRLLNHPYFHQ